MNDDNDKLRSSEFGSSGPIGYVESKPAVLGKTKSTCGAHGFNKIAVSGENCRGRDFVIQAQRGSNSVHGKVVDRLAEEVEKEISYHKSQVDDLESRLKQLRQLSGELKKTNNSD